MRRSAEKQEDKLENEAQTEPKTKKRRSDNELALFNQNIATMDSDTLVEAFKYLNYRGLAKNSLVSKRFHDVIQTHRHKLALLHVHTISIVSDNNAPTFLKVFDKYLTPEEYNEWVICNCYSKQFPLEDQVAGTQSTQCDKYRLFACAFYKDRNRLQCEELKFDLHDNAQKLIGWIKCHVSCGKVKIRNYSNLNYDQELLDFLVTGMDCTSTIKLDYYELSNAIVEFVQKFIDLKNSDEYQIVESIESNANVDVNVVKHNYGKFIVKKERNTYITKHTYEFVNKDVGKKLQLAVANIKQHQTSVFSLKIESL